MQEVPIPPGVQIKGGQEASGGGAANAPAAANQTAMRTTGDNITPEIPHEPATLKQRCGTCTGKRLYIPVGF